MDETTDSMAHDGPPAPSAAGESAILRNAGPTWGVWDAVRASPLVVIVAIIVFAGAGVAAGLVRQPKYSATARLAVLHLNFAAAGALSGFSTAGPVLAETYSRAISADGVVDPLASRFHTSAGTLRDELAAAAIPLSPVFTVTSTTSSPSSAVALVNDASAQLSTYLERVNRSDPDGRRLLTMLTRAESNLAFARARKVVLASTLGVGPASSNANLTAANANLLANAQAAINDAADQVGAARAAYQLNILGSASTQYLQVVQSAISASSDRRSKLVLLAFAGAAVGLGLGVSLAVLRFARRLRVRSV